MEKANIFKYLSVFIGSVLIGSLYLNWNYSNNNKKLNEDLVSLNTVYEKLVSEHNKLKEKSDLYKETIKIIGCDYVGGRRELLSCTKDGWLYCYDSSQDPNAGNKNTECCESIGGTWHEERCCAPDKVNSNWIGKTGRCSEFGEWTAN